MAASDGNQVFVRERAAPAFPACATATQRLDKLILLFNYGGFSFSFFRDIRFPNIKKGRHANKRFPSRIGGEKEYYACPPNRHYEGNWMKEATISLTDEKQVHSRCQCPKGGKELPNSVEANFGR